MAKVKFNKERLYEALQANGINSVRELCRENDSIYYEGEFVCRKTIERACQDGEITTRSLRILAGALDRAPEFFTAPDVIVKDDDLDRCIVYMTDNREVFVKGHNLHWTYEKVDIIGKYNVRFYAEKVGEYDDVMVAEFCAAVCYGIVRKEND